MAKSKKQVTIDLHGVHAMSADALASLKGTCERVVIEQSDGNVVISARLLLQLIAQAKPLTPSPGAPIEMLRLSNRAHNLLVKAGFKFIEGMARFEKDMTTLFQIKGMGAATQTEIRKALQKYREKMGENR